MVFCDRRYRSLEVQLSRNFHCSYFCFSVHVEDLKVATRIIKLAKWFAINFNPTVTVQIVFSKPYAYEKDRIIGEPAQQAIQDKGANQTLSDAKPRRPS